MARTFAGTVFVTKDGRVVYSLRGPRNERDATQSAGSVGWSISETFGGQHSLPRGLRPAEAQVSDFVGAISGGNTNLPTFEGVGLGEIAPGIEVELRASGNNVEKLFTIAPGANPEELKVRIDGATKLGLAADGALTVGTGIGDITFTAPVAYQDRDEGRAAVDVRYALDDQAGEYRFIVGSYDRSRPLVIDPLIRSIYSGGDVADSIRAMLIHPGSGQVYVAGSTTSTNFPGTGGGPVSMKQGVSDAFIARYSSSLTSLLRATYYGGGGDDGATALAILPTSGDIYMAGRTSSTGGMLNVAGMYNGGTSDAFLVRFDGALATVLGAVYFGGSAADAATGLAADRPAGEIVMVGETRSTNIPMGIVSGWQSSNGGGQDGFVARFSSQLGLIRTSYLGGTGDDQALSVAIDALTSDILVGGSTQSTNIPRSANGAFSTNGGASDGFVARFDSTLGNLRQSTYLGGTGSDEVTSVAVHPWTSHIYATGDTTSTDFRGRAVGQLNNGGGFDAFAVRLYPELTGVQAFSYYGGPGDDFGTALAINSATGEVYIAGYTSSTTIPGTAQGIQTSNPGSNDAFVARFGSGLTTVVQSTLLGGLQADAAYAIAVTDATVYIAGETSSGNLPGATPGPVSGTSDGFISAMTADLRALDSNPSPFSFTPVVNALPLTIQTSAPAQVVPNGSATVYIDGQPGSTWCASTGPNCTCDLLPGNAFTGATHTLTATLPYYVCVRQRAGAAPGQITESTLHIGAVAATFRVGTGAVPGFGCRLDADGNGVLDALTDGLIMLRALFGLTGTAVTSGAIGNNATRPTWSDISAFFNANCGTSFAP